MQISKLKYFIDNNEGSLLADNMIRIKLEYYNDEHKEKVRQFSSDKFSEIENYVSNGVEVNKDELLIYSIFREQKNRPLWKKFKDLKQKLPSRRDIFDDYFDLSSQTIHSKFGSNESDNVQTETAGVGTALSIISKLYDLTEADWEKIPVGQEKDLDFEIEIASDGNKIIELEAKGTIVTDQNITPNISNFKKDIERKKTAQRTKQNNTHVLYGMISCFPYNWDHLTISKILDPLIVNTPFNPNHHKLLSRLYYYWREVKLISKSRLLTILINRIRDLTYIKDYKILSEQPLLNANGNKIKDPYYFLHNKAIIENNLAFGEIFAHKDDIFYFYGMDMKVIPLIIDQNFETILTFHSELPKLDKKNLVVTKGKTRMSGEFICNTAGKIIGKLTRIK